MQSVVKSKSSWQPPVQGWVALSLGVLAATMNVSAIAQEPELQASMYFYPGNLVVSRSVYDNNAHNVKVGALLPANCANTVGPCVAATFDGKYPEVFNNVIPDPAFGITSTIFLDQITPSGFLLDGLELPNSSFKNIRTESNQLVTQLQL